MKNENTGLRFVLLSLFLLAILLFSLVLGTVSLPVPELKQAFFSPDRGNIASRLVWEVRFPRFLLAAVAGGVLSWVGQAMQMLVRNPLADPYTMGTASGATLGIQTGLVFFSAFGWQSAWAMPLWAFSGAFLASLLVLSLAPSGGPGQATRFLLVGVAVSMLAASVSSLVLYLAAGQQEVRHLLFWSFGSLDKASWDTLVPVLIWMAPFAAVFIYGQPAWLGLLLGEEKLDSLGFSSGKTMRVLLAVVSFLTACVVCLAGPLGFVGLVVPYWTRHWFGLGRPGFWWGTFLVGALFLSSADLLSRLLFRPYGLPVGLVTSLVGVPFFLYLLRNKAGRVPVAS